MHDIREAIVVGVLASACSAQSAVLTISHNDPDGIVTPGQVVEFEVAIASVGTAQFWEVRGSVVASPNVGIASGPEFGTFPVPGGPNTILNLGVPDGGSVSGIHIYSGDLSIQWLGVQAPWYYNPLRFLRFDWTAPVTPGAVRFDWQESSLLPQPTFLVPPFPFWPPTPVPTTYVGTSLTVIPGPGGGVVVGVGMAAVLRRRRRGEAER